MRDERALAVLRCYLPEEALSDPAIKDIVERRSLVSWEKVWGGYFALHLGDRSPEEIGEIRDRILTEFSLLRME